MEKTISGHTYRIGKMPARTQFHVLRRLGPILTSLERLPAILAAAKTSEMEERDKIAVFGSALGPLASALSSMPDADLDYVINCCLGACHRLQPDGKAAPVLAMDGVGIMFADIDMPAMLGLTMATIEENFVNFFDMLPSGQ